MIIKIELNKEQQKAFEHFDIDKFNEICELKYTDDGLLITYDDTISNRAFQLLLDEQIIVYGLDDDYNATDLAWEMYRMQDWILFQIGTQRNTLRRE